MQRNELLPAIAEEGLGLRVINAAGFVTSLGGAPMPDEVRRAMEAAGAVNIEIRALQEWAGKKIAAATGAEAGWVSAGAAAGLTLAVAACIAGDDPALADALPHVPGPPEIVLQRTLHTSYDHALRLGGVRLVGVGYPTRPGVGATYRWELEAAITPRTVAVAHAVMSDGGAIPLEEVVEIAHRHDLPVIVDAAAELPPVENLRRFVEEGADVVVFSGGKALRGPQASGIIAGRTDLIASVRLQQLDMDVDKVIWYEEEGRLPHQHGIGRSLKVGKEEIIGLVTALDWFQRTDHAEMARELEVWLRELVADIPGAVIWPLMSRTFYPRATWQLTPDQARSVHRQLATAAPPIRVSQSFLETGLVVFCPEAIGREDRMYVEATLGPVVRAVTAATYGAAGGIR